MTTASIASAIARDLLRDDAPKADITACFSCGFTFTTGSRIGRFCSDRCRDGYDAGGLSYTEHQERHRRIQSGASRFRVIAGPPGTIIGELIGPKPMKHGAAGFRIACAHCRKEFDSRGLRCCSPECERAYRDHVANLRDMAEAGIEATAKRQCAVCGARIPTWRNGRRVRKTTRFCSPKCSRIAKDTGKAVSDIETLQKCP